MKKRSLLLTFTLISLSIRLLYADTADELKAKMDSMNKEIASLQKEIDSYSTKVTTTQGEAKTLKEALKNLETQKSILEKRVTSTKLQVDKTEVDITITENRVQKTKNEIDKQKKGIKELIISLHQKERSGSGLFETMLSESRLSDAVHFVFQADKVNAELASKTTKLTDSKKDLEETKAIYEEKNKQLTDLQKTLQLQKQTVVQTTEEKNTLLSETKNKEAEYQKLIKEKKVRKDAIEKEVVDFEAKLKAIIDVSKLPKYGSGALSYPVEKVIITQYFGNTAFATANAQVYNGRGHNGIDFGLPVGSKIIAAQDGVVLGTGNTDDACSGASYGRWVLIKHPNGLSSLYAHLSKTLVTTGQTVQRGENIALSGNTGYSTGPHLHFTVYASDAVHITGPTEYRSRACGTYLVMPVSPVSGYLNPLTYFK